MFSEAMASMGLPDAVPLGDTCESIGLYDMLIVESVLMKLESGYSVRSLLESQKRSIGVPS